ncbi:MAG: hypothetical protein KC503_08670 [Myxococcales bacterium]|nr:hypothetical protein [Myxococcales bacterium]
MAKRGRKKGPPIGLIIAVVLLVSAGGIAGGFYWIVRTAEKREDQRAEHGPARQLRLDQVLALPLDVDMATLGQKAQTPPVLNAVRVLVASTDFHKAIFRWKSSDPSHVGSIELSRAANLSTHPQAQQLIARAMTLFGAKLARRGARFVYRHEGARLVLSRFGSRLSISAGSSERAGWKGTFAAFRSAMRVIALGEPLAGGAATRGALGL